MTGISNGGDAAKGDWSSIVKGFSRQEIEELLLSQRFCDHCDLALHSHVQSIIHRKRTDKSSKSTEGNLESSVKSLSIGTPDKIRSGSNKFSPTSVDNKQVNSASRSTPSRLLENRLAEGELMSEEQKEKLQFSKVGRRTNFTHIEKVNGRNVNVLQGLELHTQVFSPEEQKTIVDSVYEFQRMGQRGQLRERTYTEPTKWMRGKGRVTIQFGCCYNYAVDKNGNPPGIIRDEEVDPLPPVFIQMIKRMVRWHVLPPTCVPNSCIVNIYDEGDCIPPHIDHHDFLRPFCTISFLTECNILFGSNLKIVGPGEFSGPVSIPLPVGSVLVLKGNGADVAKHCVPAVPAKRISITFRKMDESKIPYDYSPDPQLRFITPLGSPSQQKQAVSIQTSPPAHATPHPLTASKSNSPSLFNGENDFPPLGAGTASQQRGSKKNVYKA
uniref:RNA demethylase ALKBH9B-like n=1 Tax=Erigeron canadensis TaxID=72917 RepID=UPI001CB8A4A2|nr:RNA demethylase ALKBH9B-like [Erigeron canadensis]